MRNTSACSPPSFPLFFMPHLHAEYGKRNAAAQELLQEGDGSIDEAGLHDELGQVGQTADQTCR